MTLKSLVPSVLAVIALVIAGVALFKTPLPQLPPSGAVSGPDMYQQLYAHADEIVGGTVLATSSAGTATYTTAQVMNNKLITHTATGALTVTLPASTTFSGYLQTAGDSKVTCVAPLTTKITYVGGTGMILSSASSTQVINVGQLGCFTFIRKSNTDIAALLTTD